MWNYTCQEGVRSEICQRRAFLNVILKNSRSADLRLDWEKASWAWDQIIKKRWNRKRARESSWGDQDGRGKISIVVAIAIIGIVAPAAACWSGGAIMGRLWHFRRNMWAHRRQRECRCRNIAAKASWRDDRRRAKIRRKTFSVTLCVSKSQEQPYQAHKFQERRESLRSIGAPVHDLLISIIHMMHLMKEVA